MISFLSRNYNNYLYYNLVTTYVNASFASNNKTFQHDDIHLWLSDTTNLFNIMRSIHNANGVDNFKINKIEREVPFYSGSNYLQGICDGVVDYEWYNKDYRLIIEIKPTLGSISGIIGQVKVYRNHFEYSKPKVVIVTYDQNNKYDKLLKQEGIDVYRIAKTVA